MFNGTGVFTFPDGDTKYIGHFVDNERHGFGLVSKKGELEYYGDFKNN